jgi:uncharacterized OsmC-like protein
MGVVDAGSKPDGRGAVGSSGLGSLAVGSVLMGTTLRVRVVRGRLSAMVSPLPSLGLRSVRLERVAAGRYAVTNPRGGTVTLGRGQDSDYTPVELLLAAIAGCTSVDVDEVTTRRSEPESFVVDCTGVKVADELGNHLSEVELTFRISFPDTDAGAAAAALVPRVVNLSHEKLCTVSRTVMLPTPVRTVIADPASEVSE